MATGLIAFVVLGMALPIVVGRHGGDLEIQSASVMAGPRNSFVISEPVAIGGSDALVVSRGLISLAPSVDAKLSGREAAQMLASGSAHLQIEKATLVLGKAVGLRPGATPSPPAGSDAFGTSQADAPLVAALARLKFDSLRLKDSVIRIELGNGRSEMLSDADIEITQQRRKGQVAAKGSVSLRGQKVAIDTTLNVASDNFKIARAPFKARIKSEMLDMFVEGTLSLGDTVLLQGDGEVSIADVREAARWLGYGWPGGPGLKAFKAKGSLEWTGPTFAFQRAKVQMDGNEAQGTVSFRSTGGRPTINGTLALGTLDVTSYVKGWKPATSTIEGVLSPGQGPFALPLAQALDSDLRLSADRVVANGMELGRGAATLTLKDGRLLADLAELELFGSRIAGLLTVDTRGGEPRYALKAKLASTDLGPVTLALGLGNGSLLQGRGDIAADVVATGAAAADILRTASGKMTVSVKEGGRIGFDFRSLSQMARTKPLQGWNHARRTTTAIDALDARLVLSDGIVMAESLSAITTDGMLTASGGGNLRSGLVDVKVTYSGRRAMQSERNALALEPLRDTVVVRGTWTDPIFRSEPAHLPGRATHSPAAAQTAPAAPAMTAPGTAPGASPVTSPTRAPAAPVQIDREAPAVTPGADTQPDKG